MVCVFWHFLQPVVTGEMGNLFMDFFFFRDRTLVVLKQTEGKRLFTDTIGSNFVLWKSRVLLILADVRSHLKEWVAGGETFLADQHIESQGHFYCDDDK